MAESSAPSVPAFMTALSIGLALAWWMNEARKRELAEAVERLEEDSERYTEEKTERIKEEDERLQEPPQEPPQEQGQCEPSPPGSKICALCLDEPPRSPCVTACGHEFCSGCFLQALKAKRPWNRGKCPLCRGPVSLYSTRDVAGVPLAVPEVSTIFGSVYLQGGQRGVASYHFEEQGSDDEESGHRIAYIDYSLAPPQWLLDDGSRPPQRKHFEEGWAFDDATRVFSGTIDWSEAPFGGDARWEYRMEFSDDYRIISGGEMRAFAPAVAATEAAGLASEGEGGCAANPTAVHRFPHQLTYWRSHDAPSRLQGCAFMQGGRLGLASYHFVDGAADGATDGTVDGEGAGAEAGTEAGLSLEGSYISYEAAPSEWRLDDGTPPPHRKLFVDPAFDPATRTFTGMIDWSEVPFNGSARWAYTMVFAEDFSSITGGRVRVWQAADLEGVVGVVGLEAQLPTHTGEHFFGRDLHYELYVEEEAQMFHYLHEHRREEEEGGRW